MFELLMCDTRKPISKFFRVWQTLDGQEAAKRLALWCEDEKRCPHGIAYRLQYVPLADLSVIDRQLLGL